MGLLASLASGLLLVVGYSSLATRGGWLQAPDGMNKSLGLASKHSFDCNAGLKNWQTGWSNLKKQWCCKEQNLGCSTGQVKEFNCTAGASNWDAGWSVPKKRWCCLHESVGCSNHTLLKVSWVLANVDYDCVMSSHTYVRNLEMSVKQTLVDVLQQEFGTRETSITTKFWSGSAIYTADQTDSAEKKAGVVVRATIKLHDAQDRKSMESVLESTPFATQATREASLVLGSCADKAVVHDVTVEPTISTPCKCPHGTPAGAPLCSTSGKTECVKCDSGYYLTSDRKCMMNKCTCPGGTGAQGEACPGHLQQKCISCDAGFHHSMNSKGCQENRCTCAMGYAASGTLCEQDHAAMCASCYPGFQVDTVSKQCLPSSCVCQDGTPVGNKDCPKNGQERCAACDAGKHVDPASRKCVANKCHCTQGQEAIGKACHSDKQEVCATCNKGLFIFNGKCSGAKSCQCPNGVEAVGSQCTTNYATVCTSCHHGYYMVEDQCISSSCHCENGVPSSETCQKQGGKTCSTCNEGYHLVADKCMENQCTCPHGVGAKGVTCLKDGEMSCAQCSAGSHFLLSEQVMACKPNVCSCTAAGSDKVIGIPMTGSKCVMDGANICAQCSLGYFQKQGESSCSLKTCTCAHGTAATGKDCANNLEENCKAAPGESEACEAGYFLATSGDLNFNLKFGTFDKTPYEKTWRSGGAVCLPNAVTTSLAFDCSAALTNFELAWSPMKKEYCCRNFQKGCITRQTGKEACENKGFTELQCNAVGCCEHKAGECTATENLANAVCNPDFKVISDSLGTCVRSVADATQPNKRIAVLDNCISGDIDEAWRPNELGQVHNGAGKCLTLPLSVVEPQVVVDNCASDTGDASFGSQNLVYMSANGKKLQQKGTSICLEAGPCDASANAMCKSGQSCTKCVRQAECKDDDPGQSQSWTVQVLS